ncbi:MAG: AAA family ATPase [Methanocorpusculum sp.]|nr:AAA family ATPase [Methanocorpusculum sp.]
MKISRVHLQHFKGITEAEVEPAKVNILVGANGMGKTSFLEGIRYGITGKGTEDMINVASCDGSVLVDIDGLGTLERQFRYDKTKVKVCGKTTTAKAAMETLINLLGCSSTTMNMMFSSELVEQMMGTDLAQYLLNEGFLKNDMDIDKLLALCSLSPEAEAELRMMLPAAPAAISLEDIQEAYDFYFAVRTDKKKALAEAEAVAKYNGIIPTRTAKDIQQEQAAVAERIGKLSAERDGYVNLKCAYDNHVSNMEALEKKLAAFNGVKAPSKSERELVDEKLRAANELLRETESGIRIAQQDIAGMTKILNALEKPVCPISEKLVCATDKTSVKSELEAIIADKKALVVAGEKKMRELDGVIREQEEKRKALEKQMSDYNAKLVYFEQYEKEKKVTISVPVQPDGKELGRLREVARALQNELDTALKYARAQDAERRCMGLRSAVDIHNELVAQLSPKGGVRQKVLEYHVHPLQEYCNDKMTSVLPKYKMVLDCSNGFRLRFATATGEMITYKALSKGEQLRAAYILMSMFNALNQFRILMLDNLDGLDEDSCIQLLQLIARDIDDYDHVFLCSANESLSRAAAASGITDIRSISIAS